MHEDILAHFPTHTHSLILTSDPDRLLSDEDVLAALAERGFTLVDEPDPVVLRHRVETLRPWSIDHPLIIVIADPLNRFPYDLWQQSHHVTLALHAFFPNLAYPVVRTLTPTQRYRLSRSPSPPRRLGRQGTIEFLLRHVFGADIDALRQPACLVAWLDQLHQQADPLPPILSDHLLAYLQKAPAYADWPLDTAELLTNRDTFTAFARTQWRAYVQQRTGQLLGDRPVHYVLDFDADRTLQDGLSTLLRSGTLKPLSVDRPDRLPDWARLAVLAPDEDHRPRRVAELLGALAEQVHLAPPPDSEQPLASARWEEWQTIARAWAELTTLRHDPDVPLDSEQIGVYQRLQSEIDNAFTVWLRRRYAPLGNKRVPVPHHVHHVPYYIAYYRRQSRVERVALLVLDGLALADWMAIGPVWQARHPGWHFKEHLVLAQIPTITAVSRQALVSGLRPADFADTLDTTRAEPGHWAAFWAREGLPAEACPHVHLALGRDELPPEVNSARVRALCLIENTVDDMAHDATLGTADFQASLRVWLEEQSRKVEDVVAGLLARGFTVCLTSDHGHIEAHGFGRPSEGLTVDTRGKRARIYSDRRAAINVQAGFQETVLWGEDGLLPDDRWVLVARGHGAFDVPKKTSVTHGGITLDEMVVPLVMINLRERD